MIQVRLMGQVLCGKQSETLEDSSRSMPNKYWVDQNVHPGFSTSPHGTK